MTGAGVRIEHTSGPVSLLSGIVRYRDWEGSRFSEVPHRQGLHGKVKACVSEQRRTDWEVGW